MSEDIRCPGRHFRRRVKLLSVGYTACSVNLALSALAGVASQDVTSVWVHLPQVTILWTCPKTPNLALMFKSLSLKNYFILQQLRTDENFILFLCAPKILEESKF